MEMNCRIEVRVMAVDFLQDPGTSGFIVTPFSLMTTELNALASAGVATSSVAGGTGIFNQTSFGSAVYGRLWFKLGGAFSAAAAAGANLSIWFLTSSDGGTTFESQTVNPPPRAPDVIIPVGASVYAANALLFSPPRIALPAESCKIVLQNNCGQALSASGHILTCGPQAVHYN
jgi:hypothetical protein